MGFMRIIRCQELENGEKVDMNAISRPITIDPHRPVGDTSTGLESGVRSNPFFQWDPMEDPSEIIPGDHHGRRFGMDLSILRCLYTLKDEVKLSLTLLNVFPELFLILHAKPNYDTGNFLMKIIMHQKSVDLILKILQDDHMARKISGFLITLHRDFAVYLGPSDPRFYALVSIMHDVQREREWNGHLCPKTYKNNKKQAQRHERECYRNGFGGTPPQRLCYG